MQIKKALFYSVIGGGEGKDRAKFLQVFHQLCKQVLSTNIVISPLSVHYDMFDGEISGGGEYAHCPATTRAITG